MVDGDVCPFPLNFYFGNLITGYVPSMVDLTLLHSGLLV